jgi:hypothetical protein
VDGEERTPGSPDDSADDASDAPDDSSRAAPAQPQSVDEPREPREKVVAAIRRFVGSRLDDEGPRFIRRAAIRRLYGRKPPSDPHAPAPHGKKKDDREEALLDEIVSATVQRALGARSPPWFLWGIPGWVTRLTHRTIYAHFHDREDDIEYIAHGVDPAGVVSRTYAAFPRTDYGARAHFLAKRLKELFKDDPVREKTFRLMWAKDVDGWTLEELAAENGTNVAALSAAFYRLRKELGPKIRAWDDENNRRTFIFFLIGLAIAGVIALIAWLQEPTVEPRPRVIRPVPTVTVAPRPTFDQALPPTPPDATPDAGNDRLEDDSKGPGRKAR